MEKIILGDGKELNILNVTGSAGLLEISFKNGDFVELEDIFTNQPALESITLTNENGMLMNVYKNYTILQQITKKKGNAIVEAIENEEDIVTVVLEQEQYFMKEIKRLQEQIELHDGGIKELGQIVSIHDGAIEELGGLTKGDETI